jgi:hypothetical protein
MADNIVKMATVQAVETPVETVTIPKHHFEAFFEFTYNFLTVLELIEKEREVNKESIPFFWNNLISSCALLDIYRADQNEEIVKDFVKKEEGGSDGK